MTCVYKSSAVHLKTPKKKWLAHKFTYGAVLNSSKVFFVSQVKCELIMPFSDVYRQFACKFWRKLPMQFHVFFLAVCWPMAFWQSVQNDINFIKIPIFVLELSCIAPSPPSGTGVSIIFKIRVFFKAWFEGFEFFIVLPYAVFHKMQIVFYKSAHFMYLWRKNVGFASKYSKILKQIHWFDV